VSNSNLLPESWFVSPIEDLLESLANKKVINQGWSPRCEKEPSVSDKDWGALKTTAIQPGAFFPEHNKKLPETLEPRPQLEVQVGDLLLTCAGPRNRCGIACLIRSTRKRLMISGKMYRFRPKPEILDAKFLEAYLQTSEAQDAIDGMKTGGNESGLNLTHSRFLKLPVPVAPMAQQKRIVAEIEKQFSRLDEAVANLKRVKANLKRYKAAVLKAAVEGKLTEEWRKQHPDVEPADKLLERILAERRKAAGKGKYKEPVGPDTSGLPELPAVWVWASVGTIAFVTKLAGFEYTKFVKYDPKGDLSVIKAENAGREGFKWTEFSRIKSETVSHLTRSQLVAGDLLMVFVGAGTGNVACVPNDRPYFLGPNIAMMRVVSSFVFPQYAELFLRSPVGNALALGFAKAVAQPSLSMETIRLIPLALPPLTEQHQIVAEVERRLSIVAGVEAQVDANLRRADRLRQSILKHAFSGQLVAQDANNEPASVLLERIRSTQPVQTKQPVASQRRHRTPAPKTGTPAPQPLPMVAETTATYGDAIAARILAAMQPGHEYARADLVEPLGLTTGQWNAAIQELKRVGKVRQVGEKRGARYVLSEIGR